MKKKKKNLCLTSDGNKTFKGYIYIYLPRSWVWAPRGHPSFVEEGGPISCLVHHTRARDAPTLNRAGFGFGAGLNSIGFSNNKRFIHLMNEVR